MRQTTDPIQLAILDTLAKRAPMLIFDLREAIGLGYGARKRFMQAVYRLKHKKQLITGGDYRDRQCGLPGTKFIVVDPPWYSVLPDPLTRHFETLGITTVEDLAKWLRKNDPLPSQVGPFIKRLAIEFVNASTKGPKIPLTPPPEEIISVRVRVRRKDAEKIRDLAKQSIGNT